MNKKNQIRQPKKKGVANVPAVMQMESRECGAACLAMISGYYGKWLPMEQIRRECHLSKNGISAKSIKSAAEGYGFSVKGHTMSTRALMEKGTYPCILHWGMKHFVVLCGFTKKEAVIMDPRKGRLRMGLEEFDRSFTGIVLFFAPGTSFVKEKRTSTVERFFLEHIRHLWPAVLLTALFMALNSLFGFVHPMFRRIFLDDVLSRDGSVTLARFFLILSAFAFAEVCAVFFSTRYRLRLSRGLSKESSSSFFKKLLCLPALYYDLRSSSELLRRLEKNTAVSLSVVQIFTPIVIQSVMMAVYFAVMLSASVPLTIIGCITVAVQIFVSRIIAQKRVGNAKVMLNDTSRLSSYTVTGITMAESLRASGAEEGYLTQWKTYQSSQRDAKWKYVQTDTALSVLPNYLSGAAGDIVMICGVYLTMRGDFTLGLTSAFLGYLTSFLMPAEQLLSTGAAITEAEADVERICDVTDAPADVHAEDAFSEAADEEICLSGHAHMEHVSFGYDKHLPPVISDFSLELTPGKRVAIVGGSGCGKSTVIKLFSGLYLPDAGAITYDGKTIRRIGHRNFTDGVAVVDQNIRLFGDSIFENIRMWDESISFEAVMEAAKSARIHDEIMAKKDGYETLLLSGGRNLSGGQRQRIEIARALCHLPAVLFLDEATSALDIETEQGIFAEIKRLKIACVIVSHRLSAVADCDEILVMKKNGQVTRGTHETLLKSCETYRELVGNES